MTRPVTRPVMRPVMRPFVRAMRRAAAGAAAAGLVLVMSAAPASAHDTLTGASPEEDSTVKSPSEVVLTYSGAVRLPRVLVTDASDREYQSGKPRAVDNKVTVALGGTLPNGEYTVAWRVVSSDGHPIQGTYTFTVKGSPGGSSGAPSSAAAQPPAPEPSPANATSTEESGGSSGWLWIGLIALVIAAAAGAVAWLRRSPSEG